MLEQNSENESDVDYERINVVKMCQEEIPRSEVVLTVRKENSLPYYEGSINGKKLRVEFDTGATILRPGSEA